MLIIEIWFSVWLQAPPQLTGGPTNGTTLHFDPGVADSGWHHLQGANVPTSIALSAFSSVTSS